MNIQLRHEKKETCYHFVMYRERETHTHTKYTYTPNNEKRFKNEGVLFYLHMTKENETTTLSSPSHNILNLERQKKYMNNYETSNSRLEFV